MALRFYTDDAQSLLDDFNARIRQKDEKGKITTWVISDDGEYYTHKAADWTKKAWFKPNVMKDRLLFNIIKLQNANISAVTYGYYHGHLTETFLNHFDKKFSTAVSTALPTEQDKCS